MNIRDRIRELRRVPANDLRPNPKNWRTHPPAQQNAMRGLLAEIGFAGAALARECDDGSLMLIDGHLRTELAPDSIVPVLVLDVSEAEADKILATYDPISALAGTDAAKLDAILRDVETANQDVAQMLGDLATNNGLYECDEPPADVPLPSVWQVVIACESEEHQRDVYEQLQRLGLECKLLTL